MKDDRNLVKIILHFDDGSTREIEKGFVCSMQPSEEDEGCTKFVFDMCGITGTDLKTIIIGMMQLGERMGIFDDFMGDDE